MAKPRAIYVGGKKHNISKELERRFAIVAHYEQDQRPGGIPRDVEIILVNRTYVNHESIEIVTSKLPGVPVVAAPDGWSHMAAELARRGLLPSPEDTKMLSNNGSQITDEELEKLTAPAPSKKVGEVSEFILTLGSKEDTEILKRFAITNEQLIVLRERRMTLAVKIKAFQDEMEVVDRDVRKLEGEMKDLQPVGEAFEALLKTVSSLRGKVKA